MRSFFGGDCRSYYRIDPVQIPAYSKFFPTDREAGLAQLKKNKEVCAAFGEWRKANGYRVRDFTTRAQAEQALKAFKIQPPVEVEITEYAYL